MANSAALSPSPSLLFLLFSSFPPLLPPPFPAKHNLHPRGAGLSPFDLVSCHRVFCTLGLVSLVVTWGRPRPLCPTSRWAWSPESACGSEQRERLTGCSGAHVSLSREGCRAGERLFLQNGPQALTAARLAGGREAGQFTLSSACRHR